MVNMVAAIIKMNTPRLGKEFGSEMKKDQEIKHKTDASSSTHSAKNIFSAVCLADIINFNQEKDPG